MTNDRREAQRFSGFPDAVEEDLPRLLVAGIDAEALAGALDREGINGIARGLASQHFQNLTLARSLLNRLAHEPKEPRDTAAESMFEKCAVCGSAKRMTLNPDWQSRVHAGEAIPIVGCGNPWHYTNLPETDRATRVKE